MSIRWKPGCYLPNPDFDPRATWSKLNKEIWVAYDTYRGLKKDLPELIKKDNDPEGLFVLRSKRGEWGSTLNVGIKLKLKEMRFYYIYFIVMLVIGVILMTIGLAFNPYFWYWLIALYVGLLFLILYLYFYNK